MMNYIMNKKKIYEEKIAPLAQTLMQACSEEKIPVFITAAVSNNDVSTDYVTNMSSALVNDVLLGNDKFPKLVNVMNGFDTVPHSDPIDIEYN